MKRNAINLTLEQKGSWIGRLFILPWIIGFIFLFIKPMLQSVIYAFSSVRFSAAGFEIEYVAFKNFKELFLIDPNFVRELTGVMINLAYEAPIIVIYSLLMAILLNQQFKGRMLARSLFFLPVIIASGVVIEVLKSTGMSTNVGGKETVYMFQSIGLQHVMRNAGLNDSIVDIISSFVNRIFDTSWKSGVQILLYLAGLQTIPRSMYEASDLEGASGWESFWKITFPLISPITLVCLVYTVIDSFVHPSNAVMLAIDANIAQIRLDYGAAMAWVYFLIVFIVVLIVVKIVSRYIPETE